MKIVDKVIDFTMQQAGKPSGVFGRFMLWYMNTEHSPVTKWALEKISIDKQAVVLDVGCGGGKTVKRLTNIATAGKVYGTDVSNAAVLASRKVNKELIEEGHAEVREASVSNLPFPDNAFDIITAFETYYFWPDLNSDIKEIYRVLKPGGELMIIGEAYPGEKDKKKNKLLFEREDAALETNYLGVEGFQKIFKDSGLVRVDVSTDIEKGWICARGKKI